jgi:hypothetical protein
VPMRPGAAFAQVVAIERVPNVPRPLS